MTSLGGVGGLCLMVPDPSCCLQSASNLAKRAVTWLTRFVPLKCHKGRGGRGCRRGTGRALCHGAVRQVFVVGVSEPCDGAIPTLSRRERRNIDQGEAQRNPGTAFASTLPVP